MKKLLLILIALPMIGFGQNVNIPDANFKAYLVGNTAINTNGDAEIQVSEATAFNGQINCSGMNIADLTGIEDFIALTYLFCYDNNLTSLDVSNNIALNKLHCNNNNLTSLDVSNNTYLVTLYCSNNQLALLDLSNNSWLFFLEVSNNLLVSLDVRNGNNSNWQNDVVYEFWTYNNPSLFCIDVDDSTWSANYWDQIDPQHYFSNNCSGATDIQEHTTNKEIIKVTDLLGRETEETNQPLFYIYDDGTVEKRIIIE